MKQHVLVLPLSLLILLGMAGASVAEHLPVRTYTTGDGLPRDAVTFIKQDSRGFIWLAAGDGLSRFDGYKFTTYSTDDGLPDRRVNDLLETRDGVYWIATDAGLCRLNPTGLSKLERKDFNSTRDEKNRARIEPLFIVYNPFDHPVVFNALLEDDSGRIWCATNEGLFRFEFSANATPSFDLVDVGDESGKEPNRKVTAILKDRHASLWFSIGATLGRLMSDGSIQRYSHKQGLPSESIISLLEDQAGTIWAGTRVGLNGSLLKLVAEPDPSRRLVAQVYGKKEGLNAGWVNKLLQTRDGKLWAATLAGLYLISATETEAPKFKLYDAKNGLCFTASDVTEDRDGNLWVSSACGALRVARNGFTGFGPQDGLSPLRINSIFENHHGELFVISRLGDISDTERFISQFDGTRFTTTLPKIAPKSRYHGWGWGQTIIQDHQGDWWLPSQGLFRFSKVDRLEELASARPQLVRVIGDDSERTEIFRLYEDSRGDIWLSTTALHHTLMRWERSTNVVHDHTAETLVPANTEFTAFTEDRAGNLWIGTGEGGGLLRYRDGKFRHFSSEEGTPPGWIISLHLDRMGRLWIASQLGGLSRIDDPAADSLLFTRYSTAEGLSSNNIRSITEDTLGRIYVGTGHGVDRLDLRTDRVKHFTVTDGLPRGIIEEAFCDKQGTLWFGSQFGLSSFVPDKEESRILPSVFVTGLRVEGVMQHVSELGVVDLTELELSSNQNQVSVDFVGLGASLGEEVRYQYRLNESDDDWSSPTDERSITFANLAPGKYHFSVRALDADGRVSLSPASVVFTIAAPLWQRPWFVGLLAIVLAGAIYSFYRYRLQHFLELERVRTRIATDLHDDVGSGLSQVSILSEVIGRRVGHEKEVADQLSIIGSLSRDVVDSMSDIVWAINPKRDRLSDLTQRMRRFAVDVFTAQDIAFTLNLHDSPNDIRLGPEMRRELYLIFKEALNNVVRHSRCTNVALSFLIHDGALELTVHDNGPGFDVERDSEGNGLVNMRQRAERLGGTFVIRSAGAEGTTLKLTAPIENRRWFRFS